MFNRETFITGTWIIDLVGTIVQDASYLMQAHFDLISGELRTLLFAWLVTAYFRDTGAHAAETA